MGFRLLSWLVLFGVLYGGYLAVQSFSNPWSPSAISSPVLKHLPTSAKSCAEGGC